MSGSLLVSAASQAGFVIAFLTLFGSNIAAFFTMLVDTCRNTRNKAKKGCCAKPGAGAGDALAEEEQGGCRRCRPACACGAKCGSCGGGVGVDADAGADFTDEDELLRLTLRDVQRDKALEKVVRAQQTNTGCADCPTRPVRSVRLRSQDEASCVVA